MKKPIFLTLIMMMAVALAVADEKSTVFERFPNALGAHGIIDTAGGNGFGVGFSLRYRY